jgi:hypothetical protein
MFAAFMAGVIAGICVLVSVVLLVLSIDAKRLRRRPQVQR